MLNNESQKTNKVNQTNTLSQYWVRQAAGAARRERTHREKAKTSRDPKWRLAMARGAAKDYAKCFAHWRKLNPTGDSQPFHDALNTILIGHPFRPSPDSTSPKWI